MENKSLLIIGSGYYTLGDKKNFGCILSSVIQWIKENNLNTENFKIDILIKDKKNLTYKTKLIKKHISYLKKKINFEFILLNKIKKDYSACIIATPEDYHYFYASKIIKKKIPVMCVKPFGKNTSECKKIINLSQKYKTKVYIDFHKRYDKANLNIGSTILKNSNLNYQIIINYSQPSNVPNITFAKWAHKTNPFQFLAPHYLDLLNLWFKPRRFSLEATAIKRIKNGKKNYDAVSVLMNFKKGKNTVAVSINCNWIEPLNFFQKSRQNVEIITNKFHIYSDQACRGYTKLSDDGYIEPNNYFTFFSENNFSGYGYESFKNFFDQIYLNKKRNLVELNEHIFVSKVLDQVNKKI
tara:strand:+ start:61 stop:1122 length:1062 start_codon:yes stop_codon:yes gene_type:complete